MKTFKRILVVVNHDDVDSANLAVQRGVEVANNSNAVLTLMTIIPHPKKLLASLEGLISEKELITKRQSSAEAELNALAQSVDTKQPVKVIVTTGRDFIEIIREVVLDEHDLLIKVAQSKDTGFGSSDFHLMRKCPQPVWLVKPRITSPQKVLAAIDLSMEDDEEGRQLNERIMSLSLLVAKAHECDVEVLSCWSVYGESSLRNSAFFRFSEEQMNELLQKEEHANREKQNELIARFSKGEKQGLKIQGNVVKGDPTEAIPAFVNENGIDVLVMGTVARTGIPGLLIGNTSETILNQVNTSVLTLKPEGFESIIK
ncbi:universal stress protein [Alteromonas gracilis]|uniref:universal stress protein n=1 Tax=Alteromonas gracilis TaxID=1479524 RepID=UPI0037370C1D